MTKQLNTDPAVRRFKIADLERADYNPRRISDEARAGLAESIDRLGLMEVPVVNVKDGRKRVVSGHQRLGELERAGFTDVDCIVVKFDDTQEMAANLAMNSTALQGTYALDKISSGLDALKAHLPRPDFARFEAASVKLREQAARLRASTSTRASDDTKSAGARPASRAGRMYALGEHRLYCGDFREGCEILLPRTYAHAIITDPPYNVGYTSGKHFRKDKLRKPIEGDEQDAESWDAFVNGLTETLLGSASGPIYVFFAAKELPALQAAWEQHGGVLHRWLVLAKDAHPLGPSDYHPQYELCMFGSRSDADLRKHETPKTNLISYTRPGKNGLHPAQKPVELIRQLMEDATDVQEIVLDPFAGSGTVLAVAQDMERVCYACEIEPAYCDVIRRRWAEQVHGDKCDWKALTPVVKK